jgi:hypothetical protein
MVEAEYGQCHYQRKTLSTSSPNEESEANISPSPIKRGGINDAILSRIRHAKQTFAMFTPKRSEASTPRVLLAPLPAENAIPNNPGIIHLHWA